LREGERGGWGRHREHKVLELFMNHILNFPRFTGFTVNLEEEGGGRRCYWSAQYVYVNALDLLFLCARRAAKSPARILRVAEALLSLAVDEAMKDYTLTGEKMKYE
jgi:hypothetical protein